MKDEVHGRNLVDLKRRTYSFSCAACCALVLQPFVIVLPTAFPVGCRGSSSPREGVGPPR
jgi:hypothetical protein